MLSHYSVKKHGIIIISQHLSKALPSLIELSIFRLNWAPPGHRLLPQAARQSPQNGVGAAADQERRDLM